MTVRRIIRGAAWLVRWIRREYCRIGLHRWEAGRDARDVPARPAEEPSSIEDLNRGVRFREGLEVRDIVEDHVSEDPEKTGHAQRSIRFVISAKSRKGW